MLVICMFRLTGLILILSHEMRQAKALAQNADDLSHPAGKTKLRLDNSLLSVIFVGS